MVVSVFVAIGALFLLPVTQTGTSAAQVVASAKKSNVLDYCWPASIFGCDVADDDEANVATGTSADELESPPAAPQRNPVAVATAAREADQAHATSPRATRSAAQAPRKSPSSTVARGAQQTLRSAVLPQVGPSRFAAACRTVSKRQFRSGAGQVCTETVYQCGRGSPRKTSKFCS